MHAKATWKKAGFVEKLKANGFSAKSAEARWGALATHKSVDLTVNGPAEEAMDLNAMEVDLWPEQDELEEGTPPPSKRRKLEDDPHVVKATQEEALRNAIDALEFRPMEAAEFVTAATLKNQIDNVKAVSSQLELEAAMDTIRRHFVLAQQLHNSVKTALSEARRSCTRQINAGFIWPCVLPALV